MEVGTSPSPDEGGRVRINVDISPEQLVILEELVDEGYFNTFSEALAEGITMLARDPIVLEAKIKKLIEQMKILSVDTSKDVTVHEDPRSDK